MVGVCELEGGLRSSCGLRSARGTGREETRARDGGRGGAAGGVCTPGGPTDRGGGLRRQGTPSGKGGSCGVMCCIEGSVRQTAGT